ncbi:hypothetical protein FS749_015281 [Ceratobasidium sp. UAMH 11750]|nr:hypothetical protein FS749_015281 [Ceratobasidium sp. UAMH 11750]
MLVLRATLILPSTSTCFGTTNGGTLPAAPGSQDICPTAYAGNGPFNPMHGGNSNIGLPPPLTGGTAGAIGPAPGQSRPPRPDSRGPDGLPGPVRELPALAISAPNGRPGSPPFRAPPPVQLDEHCARSPSTRLQGGLLAQRHTRESLPMATLQSTQRPPL